MSERAVTIFQAGDSTLEYSVDGGVTWYEVPFIGDVEMPGSPAPTSEVVTRKGVAQVVGKRADPAAQRLHPLLRPAPGVLHGPPDRPGRRQDDQVAFHHDRVHRPGWRREALRDRAAATGAVTFSEDVPGLPQRLPERGQLRGRSGHRNRRRESTSSTPSARPGRRPFGPSRTRTWPPPPSRSRSRPCARRSTARSWSPRAGPSRPTRQLTSSMTIQPNAMPPQFVVV